jgi:hypothetical protein
VARSFSPFCDGKAAIPSYRIVVDVDAAVNNIKVFSVATEKQQWIPFVLL